MGRKRPMQRKHKENRVMVLSMIGKASMEKPAWKSLLQHDYPCFCSVCKLQILTGYEVRIRCPHYPYHTHTTPSHVNEKSVSLHMNGVWSHMYSCEELIQTVSCSMCHLWVKQKVFLILPGMMWRAVCMKNRLTYSCKLNNFEVG